MDSRLSRNLPGNACLCRVESNPPFDAELRVLVNGQALRAFMETATPDPDYHVRTIDLSAFADGGSHVIGFQYVNPAGSGRSDFLVDEVTLDCEPAPAWGQRARRRARERKNAQAMAAATGVPAAAETRLRPATLAR